MAKSKRDALRAALFNQKIDPVAEVYDAGEFKVEIRRPTVSQRSKILAAAGFGDESKKPDPAELQVSAAVLCCYDDEGNKLFDEADAEAIRNAQIGSWIDEVSSRAANALAVDGAEAKND
jgi:hypothetical protein